MSRAEFMKELEYLLSDIPEGEKAEAIGYYRDYLEEAGEEMKEQILREFGSPERIASMIRSDISGHLKEGGEFTDKGYEDERFKDPRFQMAKRYELPEEVLERKGPARDYSKWVKLILWIAVIVAAFPMLTTAGGLVLGLLGGFLGVGLGILCLTLAMLLGGVVMIPVGIFAMFFQPVNGMLCLGVGILFLGLGLLALAASGAFFGKLLPFLFRWITDGVNRFLHARRKPV